MNRFTMDPSGNFRIEVAGQKSEWTHYHGIAVVAHEGWLFIGVSSYYRGLIPVEQVLQVLPTADETAREEVDSFHNGEGRPK